MRAAALSAAGLLALLSQPVLAQPAPSTLRVAIQADLRVLDPMWTPIIITQMHGQMVFDTLFALDAALQPQPQMVDTWQASADGLSWRFTLRPGLRFHDGQPVTARDVVASLRRWAARAGDGQVLAARLESLVAEGDATVAIRLRQPYPLMLYSLANALNLTAVVMREADAMTDPFKALPTSVGSGPFVFDQSAWQPGNRAVYRRNPAYQPRGEPPSGLAGGKRALVEQVEWTYLPDTSTSVAALRRGEMDVIEQAPYDLLPVLRADPAIQVGVLDKVGVQAYVRPNSLHAPFNDPRARQALLHLVDPAAMMPALVGDPAFQVECQSAFICGAPGTPPPFLASYDPARAKQLLTEAGYDGRRLVLLVATDLPQLNAMGLVMAEELRRIGVNVDVQQMDWSSITVRRTSKADPATDRAGWDMFFVYRPGLTARDPIVNSNIATPCDGRNAFGWPCDARFEALRVSYLDATSPDAQMAKMTAIQAAFQTSLPYVPVGQFTRPVAWRRTVRGLQDGPLLVFWGVEKQP